MHKNYQKSGDTNNYNLLSLRKCKETNVVSFGTYYNLLQTMRNDTAKINLAMTSFYIEIGTEYETISHFGVARETGNYLQRSMVAEDCHWKIFLRLDFFNFKIPFLFLLVHFYFLSAKIICSKFSNLCF